MGNEQPQAKAERHFTFDDIGLGKDKEYFIENLSLLVGSGMQIIGTLDSIMAEVQSSRMRRAVVTIRRDIEEGSALSKALQRSGLFKEHTLSLIRLGEESGRLTDNLKIIELEEAKERTLRAKLRSAMMYPVFVLVLTVVVGVGIAWFILPRLALVFSQLRIELPFITKVLIDIGTLLGKYGVYIVPAAVVIPIAIVYVVFFFSKTKVLGQRLYFYIPGVGRLVREVEVARFGYLLGTLLQAGLPITKALGSLAGATEFVAYRKLYGQLQTYIEDGESFQKSFASLQHVNRLIPAPIRQLIVAGERSGNLPEVLVKIGETYEAKADTTAKNLTVILEPILLVIVWLGVVGVALAIILPIYSLVGNLNT